MIADTSPRELFQVVADEARSGMTVRPGRPRLSRGPRPNMTFRADWDVFDKLTGKGGPAINKLLRKALTNA